MSQYLLIKSDEDGNPNIFIDQDINEVLKSVTEDYGVEDFMYEIPDETDANYWGDGIALLLEVKVLKPVVKATAYKL